MKMRAMSDAEVIQGFADFRKMMRDGNNASTLSNTAQSNKKIRKPLPPLVPKKRTDPKVMSGARAHDLRYRRTLGEDA